MFHFATLHAIYTVCRKVFNITFCTQPESYMLEIFWQMIDQSMATFLFPFSSHCHAIEWEGIWNIAFCNQNKYIVLEMIGINVILKLVYLIWNNLLNFMHVFGKLEVFMFFETFNLEVVSLQRGHCSCMSSWTLS